jgi:outer membrane lipoprotein-sorting protein/chaperonin cofactor prefoldin
MNRKSLPKILEQLACVNPDAAATDRALDRAKSALTSKPQLSLRAQIMRPRNLAAIAAGIAIVVVLSKSFPSGDTANFAFAEVKEVVAKTKTVSWRQTHKSWLGDQLASERVMKATVMGTAIWYNCIEKQQVGPDKTWVSGQSITIRDPMIPRWLVLVPETKQFYFIEALLGIKDGKRVAEKLQPDASVQFYEAIRQVPEDKAKRLPSQSIDGHSAVGFLISNDDGSTETIWVDDVTKLPIRKEERRVSGRSRSEQITEDIVFDQPVDLRKFSFTPPAGWEDLTGKSPWSISAKQTEFVFADVQEEVAKARSAQYAVKELKRASKNAPPQYETVGSTLILGDKKREELQVTSKLPDLNYDFNVLPRDQKSNAGLPQALEEKLRAIPDVDRVIAGAIDAVQLGDDRTPVFVEASDRPNSELNIIDGRALTKQGDHELLAGRKLAAYLGKKVGEKLTLYGDEEFTIVGIHSSDRSWGNSTLVMSLLELQRFQNREGIVAGFAVAAKRPTSPERLEALQRQIAELSSDIDVDAIPSTSSNKSVAIYDKRTGKAIRLFDDKKQFSAFSPTESTPEFDAVDSRAGRKQQPPADFYELIRTIPSHSATQIGDRVINGQKCIGFLVERTQVDGRKSETWSRTYWVDAQSKLPVEIETSFRSNEPQSLDVDTVYSNFVFDAELDRALFSTDPPEGYAQLGGKKSADGDKPNAK